MSGSFSRREFLQTSAVLAGAMVLPLPRGPLSLTLRGETLFDGRDDDSPLARLKPTELSTKEFTGDMPKRFHDLLWNKAAALKERGGIPTPSETTEVAIVGGGISGLLGAYQLRHLKPILLEGNSRFGGNSKGERIGTTDFSTGAAYIGPPEPGGPIEKLLKDLDLFESGRFEDATESPIDFKGALKHPFWNGVTDPSRAREFTEVAETLAWILKNEYPDIPARPSSNVSRERLNALDSLSFADWLKAKFPRLHPHIEEFFEIYCWSSLGGTIHEVSAAQMLYFVCSDVAGTYVLPGGNAAIARALLEKTRASIGSDRLRSDSVIIDIKPDDTGVTIAYEDAQKNLRSLRAKICLVTLPKFVVPYVVEGLPQEQISEMKRLRYRAYIVANVILDQKVASPCFELFRLQGKPATVASHAFPDLCFGSWAARDRGSRSVLSLFKTFPFDGARGQLLSPAAHETFRELTQKELPSLLESLGLNLKNVAGIRLSRFGHALPLAEKGFIARGAPELISKPLGSRVFFANQDNWASPCFESCFASAQKAAADIAAALA